MSAKQTTSGKKVVKKDSTKEVKQSTPVVTAPVTSTPVVTAPVASTPVAVASSSPVAASTKKTGGKKAAVPVAEVKKVEVEPEVKKVEAETETKKVVESGGKKAVASKSKKAASSKKVVKKVVGKKAASKKVAPAKKASTQAKKAAPKKAAVKKEIKPEGDEEENSRTRFFKVVVDGGDPHGRFSGNKPKQAANKALTSILKTREQNGGGASGASGEIKFSIIECTRGSKHKQYNYIGQRVKLDKPMKVKIGRGADAKEIEYKFNNRVMKDKAIIAQTA